MAGERCGRPGKADWPSSIRFHIQTQTNPITSAMRPSRRWRDRSRERATSAAAPRNTWFCLSDCRSITTCSASWVSVPHPCADAVTRARQFRAPYDGTWRPRTRSGLEAVPDAADGGDPPGLVGVVLELAAETADVLGDGGVGLPLRRRAPP